MTWAATLFLVAAALTARTPPSTALGVAGAEPAPAPVAASPTTPGGLRLIWIATAVQPVIFDGTGDCLASGPACDNDRMLNADTTALRAAALAESLTEALAPESPRFVGDPGSELAELATATASAATELATELRRWLDSGCGSNIGGVPVDVRPAECPDWTSSVQRSLAALSDLLPRWPQS